MAMGVNDLDTDKLNVSSAAHDIDLFRWMTSEDIVDVDDCAATAANQVDP